MDLCYSEQEYSLSTIAELQGEMLEESLTTSHLSGAETTMEVTQITSEYNMLAPLSRTIYFEAAMMVIGLVGTAANALILYGLVGSKQHKKQVLIFNQNALDLFSSIFLTISSSVRFYNTPLTGLSGYWLCAIVQSEVFIWCGITGSTINLASITIERYLKVVHPIWSKKKLHNWMIYSAAAFAWICASAYNLVLVIMTSMVIDGTCYAFEIWQNETARVIHAIWFFMSFYVIILVLIILCYWRILVVIRRQARVMAGYSAAGSSTGQTQSTHIETTVIKTMILVSALFAISQFPIQIFYLLMNVDPNFVFVKTTYNLALLIEFLYICTNPFIYAIKFDPVKQVLLRLIPCKKISDQPNNTTNTT